MPKLIFPALLVFGFSLPAIAQTSQIPCSGTSYNQAGIISALMRTGIDTPYSLTATVKSEMKLADGNTISGFLTSRQSRDGLGRTRVDNPMGCGIDENGQPQWRGSIFVSDPTAKTTTGWHEGWALDKTAIIMHVPTLQVPNPPAPRDELRGEQMRSAVHARGGRDAEKVEDLGKRDIMGLAASGMRLTRTTPAGKQGNAQPLVYVEERWVSDQYRMVLLDVYDDPVWGRCTYEVTNFTAGEPDASLFQPPADYEVKTQ